MSQPLRKVEAQGDYIVADIGLAGWGRKELNIAETAPKSSGTLTDPRSR